MAISAFSSRHLSYINKAMKWFLSFMVLALLCVPAFAETSATTHPVEKAEQYLNQLGTAKARFLQTAPNGNQLIGTFYLNRPGKLRFEYDDPVKDFIVADGFLIYFYDAELGEQTNAPIGVTLADFLLRPDLRLRGEITVTEVKEGGELVQITMVQTDDPEAGALTLGFTKEPFALKKWRVTDSTGSITEIELFQLERNVQLADNLFIYANPNRFERRYNE